MTRQLTDNEVMRVAFANALEQPTMKVKVIAPKRILPPGAGIYTGEIGRVIEIKKVGNDNYFRVQFDDGHIAAYLRGEIEDA